MLPPPSFIVMAGSEDAQCLHCRSKVWPVKMNFGVKLHSTEEKVFMIIPIIVC